MEPRRLKALVAHHIRKYYRKSRELVSRLPYAERLQGEQVKRFKSKTSAAFRRYTNTSYRNIKRDKRSRTRAQYLAALPKSPVKRFFYRLNPKHFAEYWFSREGGIMALKLAGIGFAILVVLTIGVFAYFRKDLDPKRLSSRHLSQTTKFYDRTGQTLLYEFYGDTNRTVVQFDQISDYAKKATIAIEDKNFYNHSGFSVSGIIRAGVGVVFGDRSKGGGSTITQQFIKNSLLSNERTITRKVKELILSVELERLYTKDEILALYLNEIPYGAQAYGIEAAAQSYFEKPAKDLTLDEAAMLAAMPQAPTYYSPYGEHVDELTARQDYILDLMVEQGYITKDEAQAAKDIDTVAKVPEERSLYKNIKAPHFVLEIQRQLEAKYGAAAVASGGFQVITTLDMRLQTIAEESVKNGMVHVDRLGGDNAALVSEDVATSQVLALVGSRDFNHPGYGSYNAATALRQPGSSFKPYVYGTLFKKDNWGPGSTIYDVTTDFGNYTPHNFCRCTRGALSIRRALGNSLNIPAVKSMYIAGMENVMEQARKQGITTLGDTSNYGLSLALGAGEVKAIDHVHGFTAFANGGINREQTLWLKITNGEGEVIEEWAPNEGERVLDEQIAFLIASILSDKSASYASPNDRYFWVPGLTYAVKTGTTDDARDGWMVGFSTRIATAVWTGNHDNSILRTGGTSLLTGPIFTEYMRRAHEGWQDEQFRQPNGIQKVTLDKITGRVPAGDRNNGTVTDLFPSWFKPAKSDAAQKRTIDAVTGKIATECTPQRARQEVTSAGIDAEIPKTDPAYSRWAGPVQKLAASLGVPFGSSGTLSDAAQDDFHKCSDKKPTVSLDVDSNGVMKATVTQGTHALQTLNFKVDGQIISSVALGAAGTYNHASGVSGSHTFGAEVIDVGLYDDYDEESKSVSIGTVEDLDVSGSSASWDPYSGATGYNVYFDGALKCNNIAATSCNIGSNPLGSQTLKVDALKNGSVVATGSKNF